MAFRPRYANNLPYTESPWPNNLQPSTFNLQTSTFKQFAIGYFLW
ncbi:MULTISPECIES: hypothetical protein [Moorena]|nr:MULTISPECIES: hypothetical protein [Moorena]